MSGINQRFCKFAGTIKCDNLAIMSSNHGFWGKLKKPFFIQAPMADVTDAAFRRLIAKYGKPDVLYTEFVSADGLMSPGREVLLRDLIYTEEERPIVAQIFGSNPEKMEEAARLCAERGFDGIDINMGCPDKNIEKQGSCAALIKNLELAREIVRAVKRGAESARQRIPVSVKTRIGYNKNELDTWLPALLAENPFTIILHARTRKEMSDVPADWETIKQAVKIRDDLGSETLIVGNGDVSDLEDARAKARASGCDGVMLGRAIFGNPFLFNTEKDISDLSINERLHVMLEHTKLFQELLGDIKSFAVMKKHYKAYVQGWDGAKELRIALMATGSFEEVERVVMDYIESIGDK
ncbi:tRNA-dihydrouridine synthase [Candidatus Wolfebacteria bacterium]|nr:MAG: tRNA-dihydrouridine synthase [Candidatus Wolfebacteria bacterium]